MSSIKRNRLNSFLCNVASTSRIISQTVASVDLSIIPPPSRNVKLPALPSPPDILPELEATGAPASIIMQELEKFEQGCQTLRRQTEATLCRLVRDTPDLSPFGNSMSDTSYRSFRLLENAYLKRVSDLKACTLKRVQSVSSKKSSKVRFNQESTPLLEKYFKDNAYPSPADRAMLAQKTHMTMRQIDVWNHRARGRRDGIALKRRSNDANPDDYTIESLKQETVRSAPSHQSRSLSSSSESHDKKNHEEYFCNRKSPMKLVSQWISQTPIDIVKAPPPPHAFPTRFSPEPHDEIPFTPSFAVFQWRRKPSAASELTPKQKVVDVDTFTDDFKMQLRIFEQPQTSSLKRKRSNDSTDLSAAPAKKLMVSHPAPQLRPARNVSQSPTLSKGMATVHSLKRRAVLSSRRLSSASISSIDSRSCSTSPDCSSLTSTASSIRSCSSSSAVSAVSSASTSSDPPSTASLIPQHFLSQRLSWHTSKFVQWSSLPALTLNFIPFKVPFVSQI